MTLLIRLIAVNVLLLCALSPLSHGADGGEAMESEHTLQQALLSDNSEDGERIAKINEMIDEVQKKLVALPPERVQWLKEIRDFQQVMAHYSKSLLPQFRPAFYHHPQNFPFYFFVTCQERYGYTAISDGMPNPLREVATTAGPSAPENGLENVFEERYRALKRLEAQLWFLEDEAQLKNQLAGRAPLLAAYANHLDPEHVADFQQNFWCYPVLLRRHLQMAYERRAKENSYYLEMCRKTSLIRQQFGFGAPPPLRM